MNISVQDLRNGDAPAWNTAYRWLWQAGMNIAHIELSGSRHEQDREDIVSTAIQQFQEGLINNENKFNQIDTGNDVLRMFRTIVRRRILDLLRAVYRSREDAVEVLPELPPDFDPGTRFRLEELLPEVARLQPDPPLPQIFRDRMDGLSTNEIAKRHHLPLGTVCSHFAKGLRILRERLTRLEGDLS